ncbi:MAG: DNA polymerase III subunit alpha [Bacteroidales bacterium]|nr:DNA polymerase III subunit alpha [Bacteroidales bacterium]
MSNFTHLHVHTQYSILDGMSTISGLVDKCQRTGMNALAITDHGNMFGIKEFFDYTDKINGSIKNDIKKIEKELETLEPGGVDMLECQRRLEEAKQKIFKPIFGCEVYVAKQTPSNPEGSRLIREKKENGSGYHLILLAKNETGYHNLCKMVSAAWVDGYYYRPRIDRGLLEQYHEGVIASSACLAGEIPRALANNDYEKAKQAVLWFKSLFGEDFYLELQRHQTDKPGGDRTVFEQQQFVNRGIIELAKDTNTKLIATNDVHFVEEEHAEAHDRLICLSTGKKVDEVDRMHYTKQEWLKTPEEMAEIFSDVPEALTNTQEIVDKVEFYKLKHGPIMPVFDIPEEFGTVESYKERFSEEDLRQEFESDEEGQGRIEKLGGMERVYRIKLEADYLRKLTMDGAHRRYGDPVPNDIQDRIDFELSVMRNMGFPGYFLIVQDFITAARKMGISVGPGRGSAAGSVVAYCLTITDVDPLKYDLLFERFLNPDRISLPDIDVDFDDEGRYKILEWITNKYGKERVAHIITYGTMAAKSSIKDVARVQDLDLQESNRLAKMVPAKFPEDPKTGKAPKVTLKNCLKMVPEMKDAYDNGPQIVHDVLHYATQLEGTVRQIGIHACGVIIGADDLTKFAPLSIVEDKESKQGILVTQYEGSVIEDVGLIKMDFLGLRTLSIIKEALSNIKKSRGIDVDINNIPLDDPATYELFCNGDTVATFQFESAGMQKYLKELKPSKFEDLIAMNALYRPGPMDYIPQFIRRKQGQEEIKYDIPVMEQYLKDTYGITVYQEQVMLLSRLLANFTRGESDTLRKAMGKKQRDKLDKMKPKFIEQGKSNGHDPEVLEKIWGDWEKFASYAFNKSHATCYSWVAYQTAYLKANYRAEFMAANLTNNISDIETISVYIEDALKRNIRVLGPDINESDQTFTVNKAGNIRFGLAALKGVGNSAANSIVEERIANGPYKDIFDFVTRVDLRSCNKKCIETLAYGGAFDCFPDMHRAQFFYSEKEGQTFIDKLISYANKSQNSNASQFSIFDMAEAVEEDVTLPIPVCEPWGNYEQIKNEKEVAGFYISGHPLDEYKPIIQNFASVDLTQISDMEYMKKNHISGKPFTFVAIVTDCVSKLSRKNTEYGTITFEDYEGSWQWTLFSEEYTKYKHLFEKGKRLYIRAFLKRQQWRDKVTGEDVERLDIKPMEIHYLEDAYEKLCQQVTLVLGIDDVTAEVANKLKEQLQKFKGKTPFYVRIVEHGGVFYSDFFNFSTKVNPEEFVNKLELPVNFKVELK